MMSDPMPYPDKDTVYIPSKYQPIPVIGYIDSDNKVYLYNNAPEDDDDDDNELGIWPCCGKSLELDHIEQLLEDIANLEHRKGKLQLCEHIKYIPRAKLALDVMSKGSGFIFRMLMEDWDIEDVVRELH